MNFRQIVNIAVIISLSLNFFFIQQYVANRINPKYSQALQNEIIDDSDPTNIKLVEKIEECPICQNVTFCKKCDLCVPPQEPNKCEKCTQCKSKCQECDVCRECQGCFECACPKYAKDPIPRSEVRQLDLLSDLQSDLIEYRKGKDYTTIHGWNPISFVINLKNRTDRRNSFFKMFDSHNIPASLIPRPLIFEAVNSKAMPSDRIWKYNGDGKEWKTVSKNYEMPGGYGCYLSHVGVLKMMLEKHPGKDLVLFEDDAFFHPYGFVEHLTNTLNNIPTDWGMLYFGGALWSKPVDMSQYGYKLNVRMGNAHSIMIRSWAIEQISKYVSSSKLRIPIDILYADMTDQINPISYSPDIPLAGQMATVSDIWDGNNANLQNLNTNSKGVDHYRNGKWGGGWWTRNQTKPCGRCEVEGVCGCHVL